MFDKLANYQHGGDPFAQLSGFWLKFYISLKEIESTLLNNYNFVHKYVLSIFVMDQEHTICFLSLWQVDKLLNKSHSLRKHANIHPRFIFSGLSNITNKIIFYFIRFY